MKSFNHIAFFAIAAVFCCLAFAVQTSAQRVGCAPAPPGFVCVASAIGGAGCVTDGPNCTMIGACTGGGGGGHQPMGRSTSCEPKILQNSQVSIDDTTIRQVGAVDPRLAIALLSLSRIKVEFTEAKVNFSSMELTMGDVENNLEQPSGSPYYKEIRKLSGEALARDGVVFTYDVSITPNGKANSFVLNVMPSQGAGRAVELALEKAVFGKGAGQSEGYKAISYQFK